MFSPSCTLLMSRSCRKIEKSAVQRTDSKWEIIAVVKQTTRVHVVRTSAVYTFHRKRNMCAKSVAVGMPYCCGTNGSTREANANIKPCVIMFLKKVAWLSGGNNGWAQNGNKGGSRGLESWTCNPKVADSSLGSGRDCRWGEWMYSAHFHPQYWDDWGENPWARDRTLSCSPGAAGVCSQCVCALGWDKCRAQIPSMGHA